VLFTSFLFVLRIEVDIWGGPPLFVYDSWACGESLDECAPAQQAKNGMALIRLFRGSCFTIGGFEMHFSKLLTSLLQLVLLSLLAVFSPVSPVWFLLFLLVLGATLYLPDEINYHLEGIVVEFWVAKKVVFERVLCTALISVGIFFFFLLYVHLFLGVGVRFGTFVSLVHWSELFSALFLFLLAWRLLFGFPDEAVVSYARCEAQWVPERDKKARVVPDINYFFKVWGVPFKGIAGADPFDEPVVVLLLVVFLCQVLRLLEAVFLFLLSQACLFLAVFFG